MKKLILIGGGGHCKSCIDVIEATNEFKIVGIIDQKKRVGTSLLSYPIIGTDENLLDFKGFADFFFITLGQIGLAKRRKELFDFLQTNKLKMPTIISPFAIVSKHTQINEGTIIMHHAIVNADSSIGKNCIINSKALIEHDAKILDHTHISTGAIINGNVTIKENCFVGSNTTVNLGLSIKENSIIASHSLVTKSLMKSGNYKGIPAYEF